MRRWLGGAAALVLMCDVAPVFACGNSMRQAVAPNTWQTVLVETAPNVAFLAAMSFGVIMMSLRILRGARELSDVHQERFERAIVTLGAMTLWSLLVWIGVFFMDARPSGKLEPTLNTAGGLYLMGGMGWSILHSDWFASLEVRKRIWSRFAVAVGVLGAAMMLFSFVFYDRFGHRTVNHWAEDSVVHEVTF